MLSIGCHTVSKFILKDGKGEFQWPKCVSSVEGDATLAKSTWEGST